MVIYALGSSSTPMLGLALWLATSTFGELPYSRAGLIAYFIGVTLLSIFTEQWQSWLMAEEIGNGQFSFSLLKPYSFYFNYMADKLSDVFFKAGVFSFLLLLAYFILAKGFVANLNITPLSIFLFAVSAIVGFLIAFTIEMTIGLLSVHFYDIDFIKRYTELFSLIFSGKFVPLAFFPGFISSLALILPFRYYISFPVEVLLNKLRFEELLIGLAIEFCWLILVVLLFKTIKSNFYKNYQGFSG